VYGELTPFLRWWGSSLAVPFLAEAQTLTDLGARPTMKDCEPITQWIDELKAGEAAAAEKLWQQYFPQMVRLARGKLAGAKRSSADEEDVALSAFKSLCLGAEAGRFPRLTDRDSLWSLLMAIVAHKSTDLIRRENRKKRGGAGNDPGDPDTGDRSAERQVVPLSQIIQQSPSPEFSAHVSQQFELLIKKLESANDPELIAIAIGKMMGESNAIVAQQLGCARRTVERKVQTIRAIWEGEIDS